MQMLANQRLLGEAGAQVLSRIYRMMPAGLKIRLDGILFQYASCLVERTETSVLVGIAS